MSMRTGVLLQQRRRSLDGDRELIIADQGTRIWLAGGDLQLQSDDQVVHHHTLSKHEGSENVPTGGGIYMSGSNSLIEDCLITQNFTQWEGMNDAQKARSTAMAIRAATSSTTPSTTPAVTTSAARSSQKHWQARNAESEGMGIAGYKTTLTITDCVIDGNTVLNQFRTSCDSNSVRPPAVAFVVQGKHGVDHRYHHQGQLGETVRGDLRIRIRDQPHPVRDQRKQRHRHLSGRGFGNAHSSVESPTRPLIETTLRIDRERGACQPHSAPERVDAVASFGRHSGHNRDGSRHGRTEASPSFIRRLGAGPDTVQLAAVAKSRAPGRHSFQPYP